MPDTLEPDECARALSDLEHGDEPAREAAIVALGRMVPVAVQEQLLQRRPLTNAERSQRQRRLMWRILNRPEIAAALLRAMDDPSALVRRMASGELRYVRSAEAAAALARHLRDDPDAQVRLMCVYALASRTPAPALDSLVDALADADPRVVSAACAALGKRGDKGAVGPLRGLLAHPSAEVRFDACEALVRLGAADGDVVAELEALASLPEFEPPSPRTTRALEEARRALAEGGNGG